MEKSMSFVFHAQIITDVIFMKNQYTIACINLGIHFSFALTKKTFVVAHSQSSLTSIRW